jgi:DNA-binding transcriptional regulator YhcF (GntR family)
MKRDNQPTRWALSSVDVERAVLSRIASGRYLPDHRLPTCVELAEELGVNKNTVNRAYRALAQRGYVTARRGRGTVVARRPRPQGGDSADHLGSLMGLLLQEAKLAGIERDGFLELVHEAANRYYGRHRVRVGFVECNADDAAALSRDLQVGIAFPVTPLLLDDVTDTPALLDDYDLVGVSLTHQLELEEAVARVPAPNRPEVVGLFVSPDPGSLTQVVRLRPGTRIAVLCDNEDTLTTLLGLLRGYNPSLQPEGCLSSDRKAIERLLVWAEVLLTTPSASPKVGQLDVRCPIVTVSFQLDARSVQQVVAHLDKLTRSSPAVSLVKSAE